MTVPFATADVARTASVNGRSLALGSAAPHDSLLDWLRSQGLTGAKEGCAEGECGACAVLVARPRADGAEGSQWVALNACLPPAHAFAGQEIVTAEGLGTPTDLHPVQAAMAADGGSQCGYCTPGFVCSMAAEYYRPGRGATPAEAAPDAQAGEHDEHALSGNLCRCTGYRPILEAMAAVGSPADADPFVARGAQPPPTAIAVDVQAAGQRFVRPASLDEALVLLSEHPDAVPVAGATDLGVQVNLAFSRPPLLVALDRLAELRTLQVGDTELVLGAGLTLTEIEQRTAGRIPLLDLLWPQFASRLIRNAATLGGNLGTASPIGDSAPALLALDAVLVLASSHGTREVALTDYFTGYRRTVRRPDELIAAVRIPVPAPGVAAFHKIAKRRLDDISGVAVAFRLDLVDGVVTGAGIGLGGVAATPIRARATEAALVGRPWSEQTAAEARAVLATEGTPMSDQRASAAYRAAVLATALPRLHHESTGGRS